MLEALLLFEKFLCLLKFNFHEQTVCDYEEGVMECRGSTFDRRLLVYMDGGKYPKAEA